jgi:hypothetical protein
MRILIIVIVLCSTARADHRRYTRPSAAPPPPKATLPRHATTATGPAVTADELLHIEEDNQPIRREQEALLEKLARETPETDPEKPDLMFRLAEQYAKQLRFWRMKATEATFTHE